MRKKAVEEGTSEAGAVDLSENDLDEVYGGALRAYWDTRRAKAQKTSTRSSPISPGEPEFDLEDDFQP